jgi:hypothetical protein
MVLLVAVGIALVVTVDVFVIGHLVKRQQTIRLAKCEVGRLTAERYRERMELRSKRYRKLAD